MLTATLLTIAKVPACPFAAAPINAGFGAACREPLEPDPEIPTIARGSCAVSVPAAPAALMPGAATDADCEIPSAPTFPFATTPLNGFASCEASEPTVAAALTP